MHEREHREDAIEYMPHRKIAERETQSENPHLHQGIDKSITENSFEPTLRNNRRDRGKTETNPGTSRRVKRAVSETNYLKTAENNLRKEAELHVKLLSVIPDPVIRTDTDGIILFVNDIALQKSGYSREDMIGCSVFSYLTPEDLPRAIDNMKLMFQQPVGPVEYCFITKSQSIIHIEVNGEILRDETGNPYGTVQVCRDITERKKTENALKEWKERYRLLAEASFEGVAVTDHGVFVDANQQMLDMLGYTHEEIVGKPVSAVIAPESVDLVMKNIRRAYERPYENYLQRKDGSCFPVISQARMMLWGGKQYRVTVLRDITDLKKADEERKCLEEQVYQSHKLEALGTLAGGIAHDFNNLLMAIQGYASLMLLECNPEHKHFDRLKNIEKHVKSGADLTKQLLGFARGGKYESRPTDINDLLAQNSEMFGRTKREISIKRRFTDDIWTVEVDRGQMDQVFLNLYINAWQAMPAGGNLYIDTQNVTLDNRFTKPYDLPPGRYVKVSVTDTGFGMDDKTLPRIFEPFFTTKAVSRGSGLGLASAYGIIRNHGGMITVYSQKGYGTTFNIYLPASDKAKEKEFTSPAQAEWGSETILIVDDDPANIDVISQMLTTLGYTVISACGGLQAVEIYHDRKDIDLVILDMIMPGLGGGETFDQIKKINPDVRVILSSGYSATGQAKAIMNRGVKAFIQKPFTAADFSRKIREALGK